MTAYIEISSVPTHMTGSGQRYEVWHDGAVILKSTKNPFNDGARAILALGGAEPDDILVQVDHVTRRPRMSGRLSSVAATTISEGDTHGPRMVKWVPYSGPPRKEDE